MPEIGQTLSHFKLVEKIGQGGMGIVYKARDTRLNRFIAIKILPAESIANPESKRRFVREAKAASALSHPNIIHIYDIDEVQDVNFIAMEFVAGNTLDQLIGPEGLPIREVLKYAAQIADALAGAHAAGIIHRDLKPSNIMANKHGLVKILDFGLAKLLETTTSNENLSTRSLEATTKVGAILGTASYMSPEQAEGKVVDTRSDIFSFGSVLYKMVRGRSPFRGASMIATLSAVIEDEPPPLGSEVPDQLRKIIMRCLRKDPDRRFQHIGDIRIALEELREDFELAKKARVVTAPLVEAGKVRYRRTALVGGIISLILLGVFGTVLWFASREPSESLKPLVTNQAPNTRLRLLVSLEGEASDPALSPDGKSLAYVAENGGQKDLFLARVAGGRRIQLTNDEASEADPKFSPDGERIAYISPGSGVNSSSLRILPALGGQASHVIDDAVTATWSPEGNQLAFVLRRPNEGDFIAICAADGTGLHRIMNSDVKYPFFRSVSWSPDGKQLAVERSAGGIAGEIWLVPLSGGAPYRISKDEPAIFNHGPIFASDGRGIIHASNRAGARNLWIQPFYS
jgi:serine/threonine protein kinase